MRVKNGPKWLKGSTKHFFQVGQCGSKATSWWIFRFTSLLAACLFVWLADFFWRPAIKPGSSSELFRCASNLLMVTAALEQSWSGWSVFQWWRMEICLCFTWSMNGKPFLQKEHSQSPAAGGISWEATTGSSLNRICLSESVFVMRASGFEMVLSSPIEHFSY